MITKKNTSKMIFESLKEPKTLTKKTISILNPKRYNQRLFLCISLALIMHSVIIFGYNNSMNYIWNPDGYLEKIIYMGLTLCFWMFSIISSAHASDWLMCKLINKEWKNFDIYIKN